METTKKEAWEVRSQAQTERGTAVGMAPSTGLGLEILARESGIQGEAENSGPGSPWQGLRAPNRQAKSPLPRVEKAVRERPSDYHKPRALASLRTETFEEHED